MTPKANVSVWSNPISGSGDLTKRGAGALVLAGDNSTYTGPTRVLGGVLAVDGSIASAATVRGGGVLAGTGSVGDVTLGRGGSIAPRSVLDAKEATAGVLALDTRYTLLTAEGGVSESYDGLTGDLVSDRPFVDFTLAHEPTAVYFDVARSENAFASVGRTFNQRSAARAVESQRAGGPLYDEVLFLTTDDTNERERARYAPRFR